MIPNKKWIIRILIIPSIFFTACDRPDCKNENLVFEKNTAESNEYINELTRILKKSDPKSISFWFDRYEKKEGKEFIFVDINGEKFCAKGKILVTDWNKIEDIRRTKGMSYRGAELVGFTVNYLQDATSPFLVYKDIDHISD